MIFPLEHRVIYKPEGIAFLNKCYEHYYSKRDAFRLTREKFNVKRNTIRIWMKESYYNE